MVADRLHVLWREITGEVDSYTSLAHIPTDVPDMHLIPPYANVAMC